MLHTYKSRSFENLAIDPGHLTGLLSLYPVKRKSNLSQLDAF